MTLLSLLLSNLSVRWKEVRGVKPATALEAKKQIDRLRRPAKVTYMNLQLHRSPLVRRQWRRTG